MTLRKFLGSGAFCAAVPIMALSLAMPATGTPSGLVRISSGGGGVQIGIHYIDWFPPTGTPSGTFVVGAGSTLSSAAGTPAVGSSGTILDLSTSTTLPLAGFMTFSSAPGLVFDLSAVGPGSSNSNCAAVTTIGQSCSVWAGSPIVLTLTGTGTNVSLSASGEASDGTFPKSTWMGTFTSQIVMMPGVTFGEIITPAHIQSLFGCTNPAIGPTGCTNLAASITSTWTGEFVVTPRPSGVCPLTQGYWKNHEEAWPVVTLMLGSQIYTQAQLITLLDGKTEGDASIILARQLYAAKLNVAAGADPTPIASAIANADALLAVYTGKLPYGVPSSSAAGQQMVSVAQLLDRYNNGQLTPGCR